MIENISSSLDKIANFCECIMHPSKILLGLWHWTVGISYWLCLCIAIFSLINYILGVKKFVKLIPWSIGIYALIQAIGCIV